MHPRALTEKNHGNGVSGEDIKESRHCSLGEESYSDVILRLAEMEAGTG